MNSTITLDDTDCEVIDLDASEDGVSDASVQQKNSSAIDDPPSSTDRKFNEEVIVEGENSQRSSTPRDPIGQNETLDTKPLVQVIFRDESVSRKFRTRIKQFVEELISQRDEAGTESEVTTSELRLDIWESEATTSSQTTIDITTESEDSQDINCEALFMVDTQPSCKDDFDVPTYGKQKYENAFNQSNTEQEPEKYLPKMTCFNCMGNHKLQDCQEPRNRENIRKNRKTLNKTGITKGARYHLDEDQRFGHIIPGQISNALRSALGLKKNELPPHIYRMRTLGYPPGWLEEARLQHSGLSLFNSDGMPDNDANEEPGETFDNGDRDQYDIKKIFDFPGFNVPPPPGTHDDYIAHWTPQMQMAHSKQTMLMMLRGKKADEGYRRKKMKPNVVAKSHSDTTPSSMEIEDLDDCVVECMPVNGEFIPPLPPLKREDVPPPPPPVEESESQELQSPESPDNSSPSSRANSPSLSDLENMKNRLLVELEDSSSQSNSETPVKSCPNPEKTEMPPPSNTPEGNRSRSSQSTPYHGNVKSIDLGTPVLQSTSPYNKLPSSEKFSKNICDVINYENLPDSTGKYEQMTGVLEKVRNTLSKLHQDT